MHSTVIIPKDFLSGLYFNWEKKRNPVKQQMRVFI